MALLWAALILWTAVDFVGTDHGSGRDPNGNTSLGTDVTGQPIDGRDIAALKHVVEQP